MDPKPLDKMRRTLSFPFASGEHKCVAMKVIDFRADQGVRAMKLHIGGISYGA
jgi:hypothetical protein